MKPEVPPPGPQPTAFARRLKAAAACLRTAASCACLFAAQAALADDPDRPVRLVVRADAPFRSVADLVGKARAEPGRLNYSSAGAGSAIHLASELFKSKSGIDVLHVPYKGAAPAMTAVLAGEVQFTFSSLMEARPMIESGKVRALGVSSKQHSAAFPQVPTMTESGVQGGRGHRLVRHLRPGQDGARRAAPPAGGGSRRAACQVQRLPQRGRCAAGRRGWHRPVQQ
jgi:tripartite-type tricarboxylate transporter receptor subunit TctC